MSTLCIDLSKPGMAMGPSMGAGNILNLRADAFIPLWECVQAVQKSPQIAVYFVFFYK